MALARAPPLSLASVVCVSACDLSVAPCAKLLGPVACQLALPPCLAEEGWLASVAFGTIALTVSGTWHRLTRVLCKLGEFQCYFIARLPPWSTWALERWLPGFVKWGDEMIKNKLECFREQQGIGGLLESHNFINVSSFSMECGEV